MESLFAVRKLHAVKQVSTEKIDFPMKNDGILFGRHFQNS